MDAEATEARFKSVEKYLEARTRPASPLDYAWTKRRRIEGEALPMPPEDLCLKYGGDLPAFLDSRDYDTMMRLLTASRFVLGEGSRVLDFGCGIGRTLRHFQPLAQTCDIWGVDVRAEEIGWCQQNLSPPFRFATTTTHPHLPFEERSFHLIYAMSVFTHIAELTESWLLELHRVLDEKGRLYVTILDERSVKFLAMPPWNGHWVADALFGSPVYLKHKNWTRLVVDTWDGALAFHALDAFLHLLGGGFKVLSVTEKAYGFQTGVLLERKP